MFGEAYECYRGGPFGAVHMTHVYMDRGVPVPLTGRFLWRPWDVCCWRVLFLTRARMLHQTKFSTTVWGRSFRSSQSLLRSAPSSLFIIPKTVVGASNLAVAGGLEHSILGMEISSRDCLFRARPHLHHPRKTSLFYFDPFWEGGFATILATGSLSNNVYAFAFSSKPL